MKNRIFKFTSPRCDGFRVPFARVRALDFQFVDGIATLWCCVDVDDAPGDGDAPETTFDIKMTGDYVGAGDGPYVGTAIAPDDDVCHVFGPRA